MAFHTLPVIGGHQSGFERVLFIKGSAVAAHTIGRFFRCRAVVVTALANRTLFVVKEIRQFVIFYVVEQCVDNFAMGKLHRLILIRQGFDDNSLRDFLVIIGYGNGLPGAKGFGGQHSLLCRLDLIGDPGCWNHMAIYTGVGTLLALFFKGRVTAGAALIN